MTRWGSTMAIWSAIPGGFTFGTSVFASGVAATIKGDWPTGALMSAVGFGISLFACWWRAGRFPCPTGERHNG